VSGELKNTEVFFVHPSDPKIYIAIFVWTSTIKDYKISKIYLPCNFEVNLITHLGVIALFSSNF
jgi:hypothetical protein